jgi:hypothetical protein
MRIRTHLSVLAAACLLSFPPAYAATNQDTVQMLNQLSAHMAELESEVHTLRSEVHGLQGDLSHERAVNRRLISERQVVSGGPSRIRYRHRKTGEVYALTHNEGPDNLPPGQGTTGQISPESQRPSKENYLTAPRQHPRGSPISILLLESTPVFTSPYIGIHSAYDGSDLLVNASSVNLDLRLLKQQQSLQKELLEKGVTLPEHPLLEMSGKLEVEGILSHFAPGNTHLDLDLTGADLDVFLGLNDWVQGFIDFTYDNSQTSPRRISNSRVFLRQGFITIGKLSHWPLYASMGQLFVPFGQYSTYMLSDPLTKDIGRVKARAFVLGYHPEEGLFGAGYLFASNNTNNRRFNGGGELGYSGKAESSHGDISYNVSAGAIMNLADADGMQGSFAPAVIRFPENSVIPFPFQANPTHPFQGFAEDFSTEALQHAVPGVDINGTVGIGQFSVIAEYVMAAEHFDPIDLSFNGHGARPQAFHVEAVYQFNIHDKPTSIALGYDFSKDALALFLPQQRVIAVINYSPWRDTIATLEYRHDFSYSSHDFATGGTAFTPLRFNQPYRGNDVVTTQFGVYF